MYYTAAARLCSDGGGRVMDTEQLTVAMTEARRSDPIGASP